MPTPWLKEITRKTKLTYIHTINYAGITTEQNELKLNFRSGGSEMPYGTMRLSTAEEEGPGVKTRYIHFPGYPAPLSNSGSRLFPYKDDDEINKELTQRTIEVIRAIPST